MPIGVYNFSKEEWTWYDDELEERASMIITPALRQSLIDSAKQEMDKAYATYQEASRTYKWACYLIVGADLTSLTPNNVPQNITPSIANNTPSITGSYTRYFIPSKSGLTLGHYIRKNKSLVDCTCPGFVNRGYCWASSKIKSNDLDTYKYYWNKSARDFDSNRDKALRSYA